MTKTQTKLTLKQKQREAMPIIARAAELSASIKELQAELEHLNGELKGLELGYGEFHAPGAELQIKPYRRLNARRAEEKYGDKVKELKVTPDAVRAFLGDNAKAISALYDESLSFTYRYVGEQ